LCAAKCGAATSVPRRALAGPSIHRRQRHRRRLRSHRMISLSVIGYICAGPTEHARTYLCSTNPRDMNTLDSLLALPGPQTMLRLSQISRGWHDRIHAEHCSSSQTRGYFFSEVDTSFPPNITLGEGSHGTKWRLQSAADQPSFAEHADRATIPRKRSVGLSARLARHSPSCATYPQLEQVLGPTV
jgi:hypothetical protein